MNYTCLLALSIVSVSSLQASLPSKTYTFEDSDLSQEKFLAYFNDLTEEHVAYCAWALKKDLQYCSLRDINGYYPLERIVKLYVELDASKTLEKSRLKSLFEQLFKAGVVLQADWKTRISQDDFVKSPELTLVAAKYIDTVRPQFAEALNAVQYKDIHALAVFLQMHPELVEIRDPATYMTLLHAAADQFSTEDADSVQIFAYLIRMGSDVDMTNSSGLSIAALMDKGVHEASELFKTERDALQKRSLPGLQLSVSFDQIKKMLSPLYEKARPRGIYIAGGLCFLGLVWYLTRSRTQDLQAQTNHTIQLQKVTKE